MTARLEVDNGGATHSTCNEQPQSQQSPNKYHHPFTPYPIQIELMDAIYETINNDYKVGLFESPTGTGKTLSIICSTMTWLRQYKKSHVFNNIKHPNANIQLNTPTHDDSSLVPQDKRETQDRFLSSDSEVESSDDEPEWVKKSYEKTILSHTKGKAEDYERYLDSLSERRSSMATSKVHDLGQESKRKRLKVSSKTPLQQDDSEFIADDYYSDSETGQAATSRVLQENNQLSAEISSLLSKVNGGPSSNQIESINECPVSIYFSSRTHSQLTQFSHQLNLTQFESSFDNISERIKFLPLGSRKQLCIHPKVSKISNLSNMNDACIDLQSDSSSEHKGCEYIPKPSSTDSLQMVKDFTDISLTKVHDIEDLATLGTELKICPYYSVRKGIDLTEIVALPYQMLLQDTTREIMNLRIDNAIIVIDEAHNLLDTISAMNSLAITADELKDIIKSLQFYFKKFVRRLNSGNRINLSKLIKLCQVVHQFIVSSSGKLKKGDEIHTHDIFSGNTGDLVNVYKLEKFLHKSKIAYKIETYLDKVRQQEELLQQQDKLQPTDPKQSHKKGSSSSPLLFKITQFLKKLNNPSKEGKFFWDCSPDGSVLSITYMLLDPSDIFRPLVTRSKCVLLCGGTMEPMDDYINYLFPYLTPSQINKFSCGHVIPPENLRVFPITGTDQMQFEFSFDKRNNPLMINNLGQCLVNLIKTIPGGVVAFFPSYKYLHQVLQIWRTSGKYEELNGIKTVFQESADAAGGSVDSILQNYSNMIASNGGALLFSVVGGKMSEGINFSDDLARAVIMVGLPFPNAYSAEMVTKRKYIEDSTIERGGSRNEATMNARTFYENVCMRAVNQSVGRSIRHANDYATIYLVDSRYGQSRIQQKLSRWVKERINSVKPISSVIQETNQFFKSKTST